MRTRSGMCRLPVLKGSCLTDSTARPTMPCTKSPVVVETLGLTLRARLLYEHELQWLNPEVHGVYKLQYNLLYEISTCLALFLTHLSSLC